MQAQLWRGFVCDGFGRDKYRLYVAKFPLRVKIATCDVL
jgi:hypothetical protein